MKKLLAVIGLWLLTGTAAMAQTKPDFSGDWKLNKEKSDFGPIPAPDSMSLKIEHHDPDLKVTTHATGGPQGDIDYEAKYTTDGKECANQFGDRVKLKSKLVWDGATLVIDSNMDASEMQLTIKGRWTLSEDGKSLTQTAHFESAQGSFDAKYLFDRP